MKTYVFLNAIFEINMILKDRQKQYAVNESFIINNIRYGQ